MPAVFNNPLKVQSTVRMTRRVPAVQTNRPAERAVVDDHLATCPDCREELAALAGMPAMLRKVPLAEAERLAAPDSDSDSAAPDELLHSLLARTASVRRARRWRAVAAAAAAEQVTTTDFVRDAGRR